LKAKLKSWCCPDIEDLSNYSPPQFDNFCFLFRAMVGPAEREGKESFDIQVCTPKWLLSNMKEDEIICGRHFLIVLEYQFERILNRIKNVIESCNGKDWDEVAEKVSRIGFWEFEDYKDIETPE
jgi:hypothetical protein